MKTVIYALVVLGLVGACAAVPFAVRLYRAETAFQEANAYRENGEFDLAIERYSDAIRLSSSDERFYNNRGMAHSQKGDYDRAIEDFTRAIQVCPHYALGYANRGAAYLKTGKHELSQRDLQIAERLKQK